MLTRMLTYADVCATTAGGEGRLSAVFRQKRRDATRAGAVSGTQFTGFTRTKVQILTCCVVMRRVRGRFQLVTNGDVMLGQVFSLLALLVQKYEC
jgi:hypothetical protein